MRVFYPVGSKYKNNVIQMPYYKSKLKSEFENATFQLRLIVLSPPSSIEENSSVVQLLRGSVVVDHRSALGLQSAEFLYLFGGDE